MEPLQNLYEVIADLQKVLHLAAIDSIVIGGLAVMIWGEPRLTRDADLKVLIQRDQAQQLLKSLPPDYKLHADNPIETLQQYGFIFTQSPGGVRVDLLLADVGFDIEAIRRKRAVEVQEGVSIEVCSPEDLIIYKLISTRPRDHEDAKSVVQRQGKLLEHEYIEYWLRQFELALDDSTLLPAYQKLKLAYT